MADQRSSESAFRASDLHVSPMPGTVRNACEPILDLQRLLEDRVGPVDILQVVAGRGSRRAGAR
jgi:hypothetical protein